MTEAKMASAPAACRQSMEVDANLAVARCQGLIALQLGVDADAKTKVSSMFHEVEVPMPF